MSRIHWGGGALLTLLGCAQVLGIEEASVDTSYDPQFEATELVSSDNSRSDDGGTCQHFDNEQRLAKRGPNGTLRPLPDKE